MTQHPVHNKTELYKLKTENTHTGSEQLNIIPFKRKKHNNLIYFPYRNSDLQETQESLQAKISALQQELAIIKQEKAELENIIKQNHNSSQLQNQDMQIDIDWHKLKNQVEEITQTDYFQQLQMEVEYLRNPEIL